MDGGRAHAFDDAEVKAGEAAGGTAQRHEGRDPAVEQRRAGALAAIAHGARHLPHVVTHRRADAGLVGQGPRHGADGDAEAVRNVRLVEPLSSPGHLAPHATSDICIFFVLLRKLQN
jgi:hypothetical protein